MIGHASQSRSRSFEGQKLLWLLSRVCPSVRRSSNAQARRDCSSEHHRAPGVQAFDSHLAVRLLDLIANLEVREFRDDPVDVSDVDPQPPLDPVIRVGTATAWSQPCTSHSQTADLAPAAVVRVSAWSAARSRPISCCNSARRCSIHSATSPTVIAPLAYRSVPTRRSAGSLRLQSHRQFEFNRLSQNGEPKSRRACCLTVAGRGCRRARWRAEFRCPLGRAGRLD